MIEGKKYRLKFHEGSKNVWEFDVWTDGYRLWAEQISPYPYRYLDDSNENVLGTDPRLKTSPYQDARECVVEWKHSGALCADAIMEKILELAFPDEESKT